MTPSGHPADGWLSFGLARGYGHSLLPASASTSGYVNYRIVGYGIASQTDELNDGSRLNFAAAGHASRVSVRP